jgi:hypothetical protein
MAVVLASGVLLLGAVPAWTATIAGRDSNMPDMAMVMMPGMSGPCNCADMMGKSMPANKMPCKNCNLCYAVCTALGANSGVFQQFAWVISLGIGETLLFAPDASADGIATPPALPPPILRA